MLWSGFLHAQVSVPWENVLGKLQPLLVPPWLGCRQDLAADGEQAAPLGVPSAAVGSPRSRSPLVQVAAAGSAQGIVWLGLATKVKVKDCFLNTGGAFVARCLACAAVAGRVAIAAI